VWIGFAYVMRGTTWVDRRLAAWQRREPVPAVYRRPPARGFMPLLRTVSLDPQTRKDIAWAGMNSVVGFTLGLAALTAAAVAAACVTMPLWYWAINDPHSHYGITNLGVFTVDSVGNSFAAAGIGLVLLPVALLIARTAASAHSAIAVRLLSPAASNEQHIGSCDLAPHDNGGLEHAPIRSTRSRTTRWLFRLGEQVGSPPGLPSVAGPDGRRAAQWESR
jgi:hypothetical protein